MRDSRDLVKDEAGRLVRDALQKYWHGNAKATKSPLVTKVTLNDRVFTVTVSEPGSQPRTRLPIPGRPKIMTMPTESEVAEFKVAADRLNEWRTEGGEL